MRFVTVGSDDKALVSLSRSNASYGKPHSSQVRLVVLKYVSFAVIFALFKTLPVDIDIKAIKFIWLLNSFCFLLEDALSMCEYYPNFYSFLL